MAVTTSAPWGRHFAPPTVAEGHFSNNAETVVGCGVTPPTFLSSPGVGVSSQSAGFLLPVSGRGGDCLGHTHDECSSGIRTVVAVPGGMVHCLEGIGE